MEEKTWTHVTVIEFIIYKRSALSFGKLHKMRKIRLAKFMRKYKTTEM